MAKYNQTAVKLRLKPNKDGTSTYYLDYKLNGIRKREGLKIRHINKPKNYYERDHNKEMQNLAQSIRSQRELGLKNKEYGFKDPGLQKINIINHFDIYQKGFNKPSARILRGAFNSFKALLDEKNIYFITPMNLTKQIVREYKEYLVKNYKEETASSYFQRFKKYLNHCIEEGIFQKSPAEGVSVTVSKIDIKKQTLSINDIRNLVKTHYPGENPEIRNAFIFCLNTGVDFKTVNSLVFLDIVDNNIKITRSKTKNLSRQATISIPLNKTVMKIIASQNKDNKKIFTLPSHNSCIAHLKKWMGAAEIKKHITWHSARHSFISNLFLKNVDIGTIMRLSGHTSLENLQKYIHITDRNKKQAVEKISI